METVTVRGIEYKLKTVTKVKFYISTEVRDLLDEGYNVTFIDNAYCDFYRSMSDIIDEIFSEEEHYREDWCLSEQDIEDLKSIRELASLVDIVELERAL